MQLPILKTIERVPAGMILVPMFLTSLLATFCPGVLTLGGLSTALFSGAATEALIALLLLLAGAQFDLRDFRAAMARGGVLTLARLAVGVIFCAIVMHFCGPDGFGGISIVAFAVAMTSCNPGPYLAVVSEHGDARDVAAFGLFNLLAVPAVPLILLGVAGGAGFDYMSLVTTLLPFVLGIVLGNLDRSIADLFPRAMPAVLFVAGINFGAMLDWRDALSSGLSGLLLAAIYFAVSLPLLLAVDKLVLRRPGYAAVAYTSLPGAAVAFPAAIAAALPQHAGFAASATGQIALAMAVTNVASVFLLRAALRLWGDARGSKA